MHAAAAARMRESILKEFEGDVTLGRDGTLVSLPGGSDAIEVGER